MKTQEGKLFYENFISIAVFTVQLKDGLHSVLKSQ